MTSTFSISYSWHRRSSPYYFDEDDYVDVTVLFLCLRRFLALYDGRFYLHILDRGLEFDFSPDLSTVFEELPTVLEALTTETATPTQLSFFEQGTNIDLHMERKGKNISIAFVKGEYLGDRFRSLPEQPLSVKADEFFAAWLEFLYPVLDALVQLEPGVKSDESYQEYSNHLRRIEHAINDAN